MENFDYFDYYGYYIIEVEAHWSGTRSDDFSSTSSDGIEMKKFKTEMSSNFEDIVIVGEEYAAGTMAEGSLLLQIEEQP